MIIYKFICYLSYALHKCPHICDDLANRIELKISEDRGKLLLIGEF